MTKVSIRRESGCTVISTRRALWAWLCALVYLMYTVASFAVVIGALWRVVLAIKTPGSTGASWTAALLAALLFSMKAYVLKRVLSNVLGLAYKISIEPEKVVIEERTFGVLTSEQTYNPAVLFGLRAEGGGRMLPNASVLAKAGDLPITICKAMHRTSADLLVRIMCEAYPFSTPEPTGSPMVV